MRRNTVRGIKRMEKGKEREKETKISRIEIRQDAISKNMILI